MEDMGTTGPVTPMIALARAALQAPFSRRARRELLFCLVGVLVGLAVLAVVVALLVPGTADVGDPGGRGHRRAGAAGPGHRPRRGGSARLTGAWPSGCSASGSRRRRTAPAGAGLGRLGAGLRDGPGWRAAGLPLLKLPVAVVELYAVFFWVAGLVNLSYPVWWRLFRNHPPGRAPEPGAGRSPRSRSRAPRRHLPPARSWPSRSARPCCWPRPWVTRAVVAADRRLLRGLLGPAGSPSGSASWSRPGRRRVDDSAALLRRLERDLHDGAQIRLATLAMNLGMAKEKLGDDGDAARPRRARELVDAAHRGAKEALAELRDLARGIHPPVLDNGLADALATLAARSAIPVELDVDLPVRPSAGDRDHRLLLRRRAAGQRGQAQPGDQDRPSRPPDGRDGCMLRRHRRRRRRARTRAGSGLSGLAAAGQYRGRPTCEIASPTGGPTRVTVELPLRA